jgi:sugar lactone lactonase YvrE
MEVGMQRARGRKSQIAICALVALVVFGAGARSAAAEPPLITEVSVSAVTDTSATLEAKISPQGKATLYRFEYGSEDCATSTCTVAATGSVPASSPVVKEAFLEGLSPGTLYHFRVVAEHAAEAPVSSGDRVFATRSGIFPGLPDGRAYEQASPVDKNGGDVLGDTPLVKATESGGGVTFLSTFGVPGGKGAQEFPTYLASRGTDSWSTQGLLPPFSVGERAQVIGWSPDYTEVFSKGTRLGSPARTSAFFVQSTGGGEPVQISSYLPGNPAGAEYFYVDQSQDGSVVLFESPSKQLPEAIEEGHNLYAWDRDTGQLHLAGVYNNGNPPPKGAIAGPYLWTNGSTGRFLSLGGAERGFYLRDEHAVSPDGSVYFTEAGTGQLYRRINPTAEQSPLNGEGKCTDPAKACTIHVSASHKTNGNGSGTDPAGAQPAAFQAASADGSEAFFTSPEKLTNDANTGTEQSPAQIEMGNPVTGAIEDKDLIPTQRAIGVAVDSEHIYWVDPSTGLIGRADLDGGNRQANFIEPGPIECAVPGEPGVFEEVESRPRYVAVDSEHVYWTNTGCSSEERKAIDGTGTIGRADIEGTPGSIEPEFIKGASNPQGIAFNATHIYWANGGEFNETRGIGRATIEGDGVNQHFIDTFGNAQPEGVALGTTHVYFGANDNNAYLLRAPLEGGTPEGIFIGIEGIRGVAVDSGHVYWAWQGEETIGRATLALGSQENKFIELEGKPNGVAVDAAHLYWATNGETPTNPGNDLYRYGPGEGQLTDLTPDPAETNGAEVQGVVGVSDDGAYVYFAANGVLDDAEEATPGDCKGQQGNCSLYLWHAGSISLLARLNAKGAIATATDAMNWISTPREQFGTASYIPKTSFLSADGQTLLFRSQEQLTAYDNEGTPEYYRFRVGDPAGIRCVTCNPAGEAAGGEGPKIGRVHFPGIGPLASVSAVSARVLSDSGDQAFFETSEALVPEDTNGQGGCPVSGAGEQNYPACNDVYEWEATEAGSCKEDSPAYSLLNGGCIYLLSTGKSEFPSLFADASADGKDVLFFTRQQLVGQDGDELQDVYDARVGGGLASQNPQPVVPCESVEACHGPAQTPPVESSPGTANFVGPGNAVPKHKKQKAKRHKGKKHKHKAKKHGGARHGRARQ